MQINKKYFSILLLISSINLFKTPKTIKIDLDSPPTTRFLPIYKQYTSQIKNLLSAYKNNFSKMNLDMYFEFMIKSPFIPSYYKNEMQSMANFLKISLMDILKTEFVYEIMTYCTTVVLQKKNKGLIFGRNLDYGPAWLLKENVVHLDIYKENVKILKTTHFAGFHGFTTGVRYGSNGKITYALAMNKRESFLTQFLSLTKGRVINFFFMFIGNLPSLLFFREVMVECENFDCAKDKFEREKLAVPLYVTLVEGKEGNNYPRAVVIARERFSVAGIISLEDDLENFRGKGISRKKTVFEKIFEYGVSFLDGKELMEDDGIEMRNKNFIKFSFCKKIRFVLEKMIKKLKISNKLALVNKIKDKLLEKNKNLFLETKIKNDFRNKISKKILKRKENPFLVQTNHDWWLDPEGGNKLDDGLRRKNAILRIKELYKNGEVNVETLFDKIMSQENTRNEDTVFTTLVDLDYDNQYYDTRIY